MKHALDRLIPVNSVEEIPAFANEAEEAEFWSTHCFGTGLLEQMQRADDPDLTVGEFLRRGRP